MTTKQKEEALVAKFGNKFWNELGERIMNGQKMQGRSRGKMDENALALAKQTVDTLWKEWVEDCVHELTPVYNKDGDITGRECLLCKENNL